MGENADLMTKTVVQARYQGTVSMKGKIGGGGKKKKKEVRRNREKRESEKG